MVVPCVAYLHLIPHSPPLVVTNIPNWVFSFPFMFFDLYCICVAKNNT